MDTKDEANGGPGTSCRNSSSLAWMHKLLWFECLHDMNGTDICQLEPCKWSIGPSPGASTPSSYRSRSQSLDSQAVAKKRQRTNVLGRATPDLKAMYRLGEELGRGDSSTSTYLATEKLTGEQFACKSIAKWALAREADVAAVRHEVAVMHFLASSPRFVAIRDSFEDTSAVHIIMELCSGGQLFDHILKQGHYTEQAAAALFRTIVETVDTCHAYGVMHRNLKPENFIFTERDAGGSSTMKLRDFGNSVFYTEGQRFSEVVGNAYYMAPEVIRRKYGPEADTWSCGVILYVLLGGYLPFHADTVEGTYERVLHGRLDLSSDPWPSISHSAKDLVQRILDRNPATRLSLGDILDHPWMLPGGGTAQTTLLQPEVVERLRKFSSMNKLKKLALRVMATSLSEDEIWALREQFVAIDTDESGSITYNELARGLKKSGSRLSDDQVKRLMEELDVDEDGQIDYSEFITATLRLNDVVKEAQLNKAFSFFDDDGSGYITREELTRVLSDYSAITPEEIEDIIDEVDNDCDGRINYDEFSAMMRSDNDEPGVLR